MALIRYKYNGVETVSSDITVDTTIDRSRFIQDGGSVRLVIDVLGDRLGKREVGVDSFITLIDDNVSYLSVKPNSMADLRIIELDATLGIMKGSLEIVYFLEGGDKLIKGCKFET